MHNCSFLCDSCLSYPFVVSCLPKPNRPEVALTGFDPDKDVVVADLAALLKDANIDQNQPETMSGCMSDPEDSDCAPIFANLGLPFGANPAKPQTFFRKGTTSDATAAVPAAK